MNDSENISVTKDSKQVNRRGFISSVFMFVGLVAGYGMFALTALRFLYPARSAPKSWLFVSDLDSFPSVTSLPLARKSPSPGWKIKDLLTILLLFRVFVRTWDARCIGKREIIVFSVPAIMVCLMRWVNQKKVLLLMPIRNYLNTN